MTVTLCMTAYDRPDLLQQALQNLIVTYPCGADRIVIYVDGAKDDQIYATAGAYCTYWQVVMHGGKINLGIAAATQKSMEWSSSSDVLIHIDSDTYIKKAGWAKEMGDFLLKHPEIGMLAPDIQGRYMRIHRSGYDEIEYALGMVLAIRKSLFDVVSTFQGTGFFDAGIHHQFDPDIGYRVRMLGYRVGILNVGELINLGPDSGDSSRPTSLWKGGFEFLRKWNMYFTGQFRYKSPYCLRWDEFPLNYLWRRLWLAQFAYNERNPVEVIQGHKFEIAQYPVTPGKWLLPQTRDALRQDVVFSGEDDYSRVDEELLAGKRTWNLGDLQKGDTNGGTSDSAA